ncbi:MAG TPA: hypothetical protein VJZ00_23370 [Thermoanaerobaculia bacterium]|nr:hypothetical protein [Thermoanaerobaculia bacterium]
MDSLATKSALTNLALALRYSSESEKSVNAARRAIEIQPFDGVLHANALLQLAIGLTELGKREEARLRLEDAFKRFSDAKNALGIGATEYALGVFEYRGGNAKQAETWLKSAHTRFAAENDKPSQAAVMNVLGVMKLDSGATDDGIRSLREAIALFRETSDPTGEAGALLNIGTARQDKCELADALSAYGECANAAKVVKNYALAAFAVGNESSALLEDGKFVEARQKAQETLGLCHLVESPEAEGWAHVYIATAANRQGQFDEAVRESLLARQKLQDVNAAGLLAVAMEEARTAIGTRRLSDASIILDAAQKTASEPHFELYLPAVLSVVAELREAEGDVVKTREALTAARDMNVRHGIRNCEARRIEQRLAALTATTAGPPRSSARTQSTVPDARAGG